MSRHILLIQDDAAAAKTILDALSNSSGESFQVEWVRRCSEGLERLAGTERREQMVSIAAILIDLFLPDSRGIETFDRLFRVAPQIPILILCTPPEEETAKLAVQCGAQDYLFKARLDAYLLPKAVGSMIERAANSEALFEQRERAQITLNSIGDAVMSTDVSGHVTYLNAIADGLTGWLQEEEVGHPPEDVFRIVDAAQS
jgi:DNA-binding response OmpR family regulator